MAYTSNGQESIQDWLPVRPGLFQPSLQNERFPDHRDDFPEQAFVPGLYTGQHTHGNHIDAYQHQAVSDAWFQSEDEGRSSWTLQGDWRAPADIATDWDSAGFVMSHDELWNPYKPDMSQACSGLRDNMPATISSIVAARQVGSLSPPHSLQSVGGSLPRSMSIFSELSEDCQDSRARAQLCSKPDIWAAGSNHFCSQPFTTPDDGAAVVPTDFFEDITSRAGPPDWLDDENRRGNSKVEPDDCDLLPLVAGGPHDHTEPLEQRGSSYDSNDSNDSDDHRKRLDTRERSHLAAWSRADLGHGDVSRSGPRHSKGKTYHVLLWQCLQELGAATAPVGLHAIYGWFRDNTDKGHGATKCGSMENSIRHNLSQNEAFAKAGSLVGYWSFAPGVADAGIAHLKPTPFYRKHSPRRRGSEASRRAMHAGRSESARATASPAPRRRVRVHSGGRAYTRDCVAMDSSGPFLDEPFPLYASAPRGMGAGAGNGVERFDAMEMACRGFLAER